MKQRIFSLLPGFPVTVIASGLLLALAACGRQTDADPVETTGAAIPQFVYIYEWKEEKPELLWYFRTGDRADGGLKDLRVENNELVVELYGQDRFLLGEVETGKITGDEEQLCCPTHFTRSAYKWNGTTFLLQGKRHTYAIADRSAPIIFSTFSKMNDRNRT